MKTAILKLKDIRPAAYNPRVTLQPGDKEYEALKNSMERFGVAEPLVVNETTGNLVSGHQRLNVLKASGVTEVEVVLIEVDEEQEKPLNVALNKVDGEWDYRKLEALFSEFEPEDIKFTGFSAEELDNLFDTGLPADDDNNQEDGSAAEDTPPDEDDEEPAEAPEKPAALKEFNIFLSFPTKELAEKWLHDRGVEAEYGSAARNITIRMEGLDYGTRY